jgi:hypothetical protein
MSGSSWYETPPARRQKRLQRRDLVECLIASLLLTGLLGLLAANVAHDEPAAPGPGSSATP